MTDDDRGVDELIELADEIPDRLGLSEGLAEIRATAEREGLSVTVDVHGMLVALDIGEAALELGPAVLAAEISRLSTEAGTRALHEGLRAVKAGCTPAVTAAVGEVLALEEEPAAETAETLPPPRRRAPVEDDEEGFVLSPVKD
ncbi:hypothetical protein [Amycolatopsis saalfeldensis]|uniref:YbaB/EbfC DNA-binding family protein n=1 Tax=Amycolatopsis saalfeldensis TaxID=394193 RepID=A0A1H8XEP5_9PSEU|nr:hypothetical protein [Amycolatopsis saalfeldensis]SEP38319.1 hypothetical protein SAMN04489732_107137 [Amycolatopsis saalfeldensis]